MARFSSEHTADGHNGIDIRPLRSRGRNHRQLKRARRGDLLEAIRASARRLESAPRSACERSTDVGVISTDDNHHRHVACAQWRVICCMLVRLHGNGEW